MTVLLPEGETLFRRVKNRVSRESALAFYSALAVGLITHFYMLVNKLPNHDDIIALFAGNDMTYLGRWFLSVPAAFSSRLSVPWINGLIAVFSLALTAVLVVRTLRLRRPVMIVLASAVIMTFPTAGYTLTHMYVADAFLFAQLLAVLGVYLADRFRWGFLPGGVLAGLSIACYQAYIFSAVALAALRGMQILLDHRQEDRQVLKKALGFLLLFAVAAAVYKLGLEICLRIRNVTLSSYMGLDQLQSFSLARIFARIPGAYQAFFRFMGEKSEVFSGRYMRAAFSVCVGICGLFPVYSLLRSRERRPLRWILLLVLLCGLPLAFFGIYLVSEQGVHSLMQYSLCFVFIMVLALYDGFACRELAPDGPGKKPFRQCLLVAGYALTLGVAALSLQWASRTNQMYLALELKFDNMLSMATRIVDRVEQVPEYVPEETPVWITGQLNQGSYQAVKDKDFAKASFTDASGREGNYTFFFHNYYFREFVNSYVGVTFREPEQAAVDKALASPEFAQMPYFPRAGSVKYIDGVIVINAGPNPQDLQ